MGFSSIVTYIVMFFSLIIVITSIVMIYGNLIETNLLLAEKQEIAEEQAQTSISIYNITHNSGPSPDETLIYVLNDGNRKLELNSTDVFINNTRIPRDVANRTIQFNGTNVLNPLHWDPGEMILINVSMDLTSGTSVARVITEYGVKDSFSFDV